MNQPLSATPKFDLRLPAAFLLFALSLYPLRLWLLNWAAWGFLISVVLDRSVPRIDYIIGVFKFSSALFLYTGWAVFFYDPGVFVFSAGAAILSLTLILVLLRGLAGYSADPARALVILPCAWIVIHFVSEYLPLATITLDPLFDAPLLLMQSASIAGIRLYQAVLIGLVTSAVLTRQKKFRAQALTGLICFASLMGMAAAYGAMRLHTRLPAVSSVPAVLVQHNLTPDLSWRLSHTREIIQTYENWTQKARTSKPDLIIFPQYDIGKDVFRSPELISVLAQQAETSILFSSYIPVNSNPALNNDFKNIAFLYGPDGRQLDLYESIEPFPFRLNPPIAASTYKLLNTPWGWIAMHLCYENALARLVRKSVGMGALAHIDLANPGFFNHTSIPFYHLLQDKLRAIETGQYVYRVATNGESGVLDPMGRVEKLSKLNEAAMIETKLRLMPSTTLYMKAPWLLPLLAAVFLLFQFIARPK